jgi:hypothetical protein
MLDRMNLLFRFQAIAEAGSVRKASETLNITQPALSRSLGQLEQAVVEGVEQGLGRDPQPAAQPQVDLPGGGRHEVVVAEAEVPHQQFDVGLAGSWLSAKAKTRQRPSLLTTWPRCSGFASARRMTGAEWNRIPTVNPFARRW